MFLIVHYHFPIFNRSKSIDFLIGQSKCPFFLAIIKISLKRLILDAGDVEQTHPYKLIVESNNLKNYKVFHLKQAATGNSLQYFSSNGTV